MQVKIWLRRAITFSALSIALLLTWTAEPRAQSSEKRPSVAPNFRSLVIGFVDLFRRPPELLRVPVAGAELTSGFGMRRNPIHATYRLHAGVDWSAPDGSPILAAGDGVVISAGWESGYGYTTRILDNGGVDTMYAHQTAIAVGIEPGTRVRQGDIIGAVGATGSATGPHLHYEVRIDGQLVDPLGDELRLGGLVGG